jgi:23S rRNA (uracil1939-C5)-methyltransferase
VIERLAIARMGRRGDGIADGETGPIYVPCTLPGETAEVEDWPGHPDRRRLVAVEVPSPERIAPICPHFGTCGGCAVQHWELSRYREWKRGLVVEALEQAGLATAAGALVDPLLDAHGEGRRRAVFHAWRRSHDVLEVGFAAARSHRVVAIDHCPVLAPSLGGAIEAAWAIAEALAGEGKPLDIQVTATESGLDVDVRGSGPLPPTRMAELARLAERHRLARLTRHGDLVAQRAPPVLTMGGAKVVLPPGAFLQATGAGEAALAALVAEHCGSARTIADLFSGVGPFALRLAERARITAADIDEDAVAALRNAARTSGLKPVAAERRDLFQRPFIASELARLDAVVFDPPRQGAETQAREIAKSKVPIAVAVSCNPATFARDAAILVAGGYRMTRATPVDQFLYSAHVEIVGRFAKVRERASLPSAPSR